MSHVTAGSKVYILPTGGLIADMHVVISAVRQGFENRKFTRAKKIEELKQCFPTVRDEAALENLLDGFYSIRHDGAVLVDNVSWGRR